MFGLERSGLTVWLTCGRAFDGIHLGTCESAISAVYTLGRRRSPARQVEAGLARSTSDVAAPLIMLHHRCICSHCVIVFQVGSLLA